MFHVPSVEEWWRLTAKYPQFRMPSNLTLKEYGYMRLFDHIEEHKPQRILEFGHGFSSILFDFCEERNIEIWGVDDHMNLWYFPPRDAWLEAHKTAFSHLKTTKLVLGQLGTCGNTIDSLPTGYFDMVCSVSVLEELPDPAIVTAIIAHARQLLRMGGIFINTHDIKYNDATRRQLIYDVHGHAEMYIHLEGPEYSVIHDLQAYIPLDMCLLENPTMAMCCYNFGESDRPFTGHWTTLLMSALKRY
jgi:hypothetical protein